jgi:hypothetical protein
LILFVGGDGDLFPVHSLMGYLSGGIDCLASSLAVYAFYGTHFIIFFLFFALLIFLDFIGVFSWIQQNIVSPFL